MILPIGIYGNNVFIISISTVNSSLSSYLRDGNVVFFSILILLIISPWPWFQFFNFCFLWTDERYFYFTAFILLLLRINFSTRVGRSGKETLFNIILPWSSRIWLFVLNRVEISVILFLYKRCVGIEKHFLYRYFKTVKKMFFYSLVHFLRLYLRVDELLWLRLLLLLLLLLLSLLLFGLLYSFWSWYTLSVG